MRLNFLFIFAWFWVGALMGCSANNLGSEDGISSDGDTQYTPPTIATVSKPGTVGKNFCKNNVCLIVKGMNLVPIDANGNHAAALKGILRYKNPDTGELFDLPKGYKVDIHYPPGAMVTSTVGLEGCFSSQFTFNPKDPIQLNIPTGGLGLPPSPAEVTFEFVLTTHHPEDLLCPADVEAIPPAQDT